MSYAQYDGTGNGMTADGAIANDVMLRIMMNDACRAANDVLLRNIVNKMSYCAKL